MIWFARICAPFRHFRVRASGFDGRSVQTWALSRKAVRLPMSRRERDRPDGYIEPRRRSK
jgi:hypothetical protein